MSGSAAVGRPAGRDWRDALTTKAPYVGVDTPPAELPDGFVPVGIELVCRHGSRTIAKLRTAQQVDAILSRAAERGALTPAGADAADALRGFVATTEAIGAGRLTQRGRAEMRGIASRMTCRCPSLFEPSIASATSVEARSASKERTRESAQEFVDALSAGSDRRAPQVRDDDALLYFHKSDTRYRDYLSHDVRLAAVLAAARAQRRTQEAARTLLGAVVAPAFVDELARGMHSDLATDDIDAASSLHAVWQVDAAGSEDPVRLTGLLPLSALEWFSYLDDLETFYKKGPAFAGDDITFAMAWPLFDDLVGSARARLRDDHAPAVHLRFTHAEEILPLATLLQIPTADHPVTEAETYTYAANPFRGAHLAPMAANIQWETYTNGTTALVRMLVNELPTRFASALRPAGRNPDLYELSEIEQFYRRRG